MCSITALVLYLAVDSFRNYGVDVQRIIMHSGGWYESVDAVNWNITLGCAIFAGLSALFHLLMLISRRTWRKYIKSLESTKDKLDDKQTGLSYGNAYRWVEYSLSASVMNLNILAICGVRDVTAYILTFGLTGLLMLYGLCLEVMKNSEYYYTVLIGSWLFYSFGSLAIWVNVLSYDPLSSVPLVAWVSLSVIWVMFNFFGLWQFGVKSPCCSRGINPYTYEKGYYLLSLTAKVSLFALVIWGGAMSSSWLNMPYTCYNNSMCLVPCHNQTFQAYTLSPTPTPSPSPTIPAMPEVEEVPL